MHDEALYYNAVAVALDGDPQLIRSAKEKCGALFESWKAAYELLANTGRSPPDPEAEWKKLADADIRLIFSHDPAYPPLLREIYDPPFALYVLGDLPTEKSVSIVGTRRATPDGRSLTKKFAREIAGAGLVVASGLALGIDAAAHEGCLDANGNTIAVLANGLPSIYPTHNEKLARRILASGGAIISEYPFRMRPYDYRFLERNRIVSGLSHGVLVVECPKNSGSLATARFALEQNRDVFVVPGSVTHPNFFGSHSLIRQGAELVTNPQEIIELYNAAASEKAMKKDLGATPEENQVLHALQGALEPLDIDKIVAMTKLEAQIVTRALSFLLVRAIVTETEAGYIIE